MFISIERYEWEAVQYRDRVSTVMSIKTFEIPAVTVPCIDRNWYGQFTAHTIENRSMHTLFTYRVLRQHACQ